MSMEKICYDEPDSCYSCNCIHESGEFIVCSKKRKSKCLIMFDQLHQTEDDMEIEYRRAVIRAKNCPNYNKRMLEFKELYASSNN